MSLTQEGFRHQIAKVTFMLQNNKRLIENIDLALSTNSTITVDEFDMFIEAESLRVPLLAHKDLLLKRIKVIEGVLLDIQGDLDKLINKEK